MLRLRILSILQSIEYHGYRVHLYRISDEKYRYIDTVSSISSTGHRVIPQDGAERRNQEEERKKYHNKPAEAIRNMQFGPSLASLTKLFKS